VPAVDEKQAAKLTFEDALDQLETLVEAMEAGDTPLAEMLARFEEGNRLLKVCEARLKDAELKIEQIKLARDGSATLIPLTPPEEA
jgi:exodeoxyribonuclease VII small subunit